MQIPLDGEGFVQTFAADDDSGIAAFLEEWGFVAVRNCLSAAECEETLADCWSYLESEGWRRPAPAPGALGGVDRADPGTWDSDSGWPGGMALTEGIIGEEICWTRRSLINRASPVLYRVFSALLGETELLVSHDRYGFMRPAAHHPERRTDRNLHFDCNPWTKFGIDVDTSAARTSLQDARDADARPYEDEGDFIREGNYAGTAGIQAMINLVDNRREDGGFHCVPKAHQWVEAWAAEHVELGERFAADATFCPFFWVPGPASDEDALEDLSGLEPLAQRVPVRAGDGLLCETHRPRLAAACRQLRSPCLGVHREPAAAARLGAQPLGPPESLSAADAQTRGEHRPRGAACPRRGGPAARRGRRRARRRRADGGGGHGAGPARPRRAPAVSLCTETLRTGFCHAWETLCTRRTEANSRAYS